ncbi:NAD-dependent epimerase/dehydratase family protein [Pajaroellobacter abortibovis]|uniref:Sugar dehydratase n=1 Tax=Pajaroellobacter abortibovis TaxID=1882918 RepID=A0A1L6MVM0_9BACT|nr:NAD-dependent epimerase/dehydratase family protein [Pajaroellobacter abortibovis]APR99590.1 sugar dehydratase [Pajaroellobacter abortibovis]
MVQVGFWRDRPTFVTGGTGLVGSWLIRRLLDLGAGVICLIRDWIPEAELVRSQAIQHVKVVRGDVRDQNLLERLLGEYEIDTVFHLAAQTVVPVANRNPISTFESNIAGTWSLLEACRRSPQVQQIIVASSDKAYGEGHTLPYTEDMPLRGSHPYDVSKSCADLIVQSYTQTYQLPVVITRCGNFYGGGDLNWNRIVPGTIRSILRSQAPIIRSNGTCVRDYLYVEDGAAAYVLLAEKLAARRELVGHAFNFSNDVKITVLELVEKISKLMNSNLVPYIQNTASHEIQHQYLSSAKARRELQWNPLFTLGQGLERTIAWYADFLGNRA